MIKRKEILKILVVEDNPGDARFISENLKYSFGINLNVGFAESVADAFKFIDSNVVDIILLDLGLPDSKGFDTFNKIKNYWEDGPVIVLTGNNDDELAGCLFSLELRIF